MRPYPTRCENTSSAIMERSPDRSIRISSTRSPGASSRGALGRVISWTLESRKLRRERGPFASDDELLLAASIRSANAARSRRPGPIDVDYPLASTPLATLLREIAQRRDISSFHFVQKRSSSSETLMTMPAIITVAITGAIPRKADSPAVPVDAERADRIARTKPLKRAQRSRISMCAIQMRARVPTRRFSLKFRRASPSIAPA